MHRFEERLARPSRATHGCVERACFARPLALPPVVVEAVLVPFHRLDPLSLPLL